MVSILALLASCTPEEAAGPGTDGPLPEWIVSVEPQPRERSATLRRVEVVHTVLAEREGVRLSIDRTDVTAYADLGRPEDSGEPARLVYDFEQARDFLPLEPGEHTATARRVRLTGEGSRFEVLDSYRWTFTIQ